MATRRPRRTVGRLLGRPKRRTIPLRSALKPAFVPGAKRSTRSDPCKLTRSQWPEQVGRIELAAAATNGLVNALPSIAKLAR
jgi:hypothetical protein